MHCKLGRLVVSEKSFICDMFKTTQVASFNLSLLLKIDSQNTQTLQLN